MDQTARDLTRYFRSIQQRANLGDYDFGSAEPFSEVPASQIDAGRLPPELVTELFENKRRAQGKTQRGARQATGRKKAADEPLDLVISLVTLQGPGNRKSGLLLLPASLQQDGTLAVDLESKEPWIPASRLAAPGAADSSLLVGPLASLWKYRLHQWPEAVSKVETWSDAVAATRRLFAAVAEKRLDELAKEHGATVITDTCFVSAGEVIIANRAILDLYTALADPKTSAEQNQQPLTYERLLSLAAPQQGDSDPIDRDVQNLRRAAIASCGSMSDAHPLTDSQRRAVHAFLFDTHDDKAPITAVSGPPGTGKTTLLQSVVASTLVGRALADGPAPLIVGTSTNNQAVTNIIDSFTSVTKDEPGALDRRWLPRAQGAGAGTEPMSGIAVYCPSGQRAAAAEKAGYLIENLSKAKTYTDYSAPDYVAAATGFFLDGLREYASGTGGLVVPVETPAAAAEVLRGALRRIDEFRRELITRKAQADQALGVRRSEQLANQAGALEAKIRATEAERAQCLARLDFWTARRTDARRRPGWVPGDDSFVIEQHHLEHGERCPRQESLDGYVACYDHLVQKLSADIAQDCADRQRVNQEAAAARAAEAAEMAPTPQMSRLVRGLELYGAVDADTAPRLAWASSLRELDILLDTTVRYAQFWLAVHFYEARWLAAVSGVDLIPVDQRYKTTGEVMARYWEQSAALTPCFVMTAYQLPKYFTLFSRGDGTAFDLNRIDLLIVDEAGQVDTSVGAAAFALTKRALVVGDVQQLAPVWSIDEESDREIAGSHGLAQLWPAMEASGLTSSLPSSLMAAASAASRWTYGPEQTPGLFLSEHFRCHPGIIGYCNELLYRGLLRPSRPLDGYRLDGRTPGPFLFRTVPGSQSRKSGSSRVNEPEAVAVAEWIAANYDYFDDLYNPDDTSAEPIVGVVTPFAAQARLITEKISRLAGRALAEKITVGTAHRLQGAERPVVLFSAVYGDNDADARFIDDTLPLMNVAVSRAKDLFIVFGAAQRWQRDSGPVFGLVRRYAVADDCRFADPHPEPPAPEISEAPPAAPTPAEADGAEADGADEDGADEDGRDGDGAGYRTVSREEDGYAIARDLAADWAQAGMLLQGRKPTAQALNALLLDAGLIQRTGAGTIPTADGAKLGIAAYTGERNGERYVNVIYSPAAREALAARISGGEWGR